MKRRTVVFLTVALLLVTIHSLPRTTHAEAFSPGLTSFGALAGVLGLKRSDPGFRLSSLEVDMEVNQPLSLVTTRFSADLKLCGDKLPDIENWLFGPAEKVTEVTIGGVPVEIRKGLPFGELLPGHSLSLPLGQSAPWLGPGSTARFVVKVTEDIPREWELRKYGFVADLQFALSEILALCPQGTTWTLRVTVPRGWSAITQGEPVGVDSREGGDTTTFAWTERVSWMGANFLIIVGPYRRVDLGLSGDFGLWVLEGDADPVDDLARVVAETLRRTNEIMSAQMGMPELKKLEVVKASVPGQSVHGKGPVGLVLVEYGRGVAFRQDRFLQVFSHELVHQWFPGSTDLDFTTGLWLSEGMTTYFDARFLRDEWPPDRRLYGEYEPSSYSMNEVSAGFATVPGALKKQQIYIKGAWVAHMLRKMVGDEAFRRTLLRFYAPNAAGLKGSAEFQQIAEEESGLDLDRFFKAWLDTATTPEVSLESISVRRVRGGWKLNGTLANPSPMPLPPVTVGVVKNGNQVASTTVTLPDVPGQTVQRADFEMIAPSLFATVVVDPESDILNTAKSGRSAFLLFVWAKQRWGVLAVALALPAICAVIVGASMRRSRSSPPAGDALDRGGC